ncbi:MAG: apolipoprotein N-acyltransferase [Verrucomicrobiota bacterium]
MKGLKQGLIFFNRLLVRLSFSITTNTGLIPYALAIFSGLSLTLAFPPFEQDWLAWVALLPLAFLSAYRKVGIKESFCLGAIMGVVHYLTSLFWLTEVTWVGWIFLASYLALYPMVWFCFWCRLLDPIPDNFTSVYNISRAWLGASAWVCLEWLRGWLFTGFPWNNIGVSQVKVVGLTQIAEVGGGLIISWLVVQAGLTICLTIRRLHLEATRKQRTRAHMEFTCSALLIGISLSYGMDKIFSEEEVKKQITVLAVQPDLPQDPWKAGVSLEESIAKLEVLTQVGLMQYQGEDEIDLIIWPETPVPHEIISHGAFHEMMVDLNARTSNRLLLGSNVSLGYDSFNAAVLFEGLDEDPEFYYKMHLVPFGEFLPGRDLIPFLRKFIPIPKDFSSGTDLNPMELEDKSISIIPLICFEDIFSYLVRKKANQGGDLLVTITNDGWFNRSAESKQHLWNAIYRAIEVRRPMVRVGNNGVTCLISSNGFIEEKLADPVSGSTHDAGYLYLTVEMPPPEQTLYMKFGDWVPMVSFIMCLWWFLRALLKGYQITKISKE